VRETVMAGAVRVRGSEEVVGVGSEDIFGWFWSCMVAGLVGELKAVFVLS
jgi:hypothetical protein